MADRPTERLIEKENASQHCGRGNLHLAPAFAPIFGYQDVSTLSHGNQALTGSSNVQQHGVLGAGQL